MLLGQKVDAICKYIALQIKRHISEYTQIHVTTSLLSTVDKENFVTFSFDDFQCELEKKEFCDPS